MSEDVKVKISLDSKGFESGMNKVQSSMGKVSQGMGKMGSAVGKVGGAIAKSALAMGTAFAGATVLIGKKSLEAASHVEEMENKFNVVFKTTGAEVDKWAGELADSIGRAKSEIKGTVANMADLMIGMGMTEQEAGKLSKQATELAYDLASLNELDDQRAAEAMTKALFGEFEMMKALGVQLSVATMNESDYAKAIGKTWGEMSKAERAEAVYQEALKQSPNAIGDAKRSAMSYANQMKRLQARTLEVYEAIGKYLLPIFTPIVTKMGDMAEKARDLITEFGELYASTGDLKGSFEQVFGSIDEIMSNIMTKILEVGGQIAEQLPTILSNALDLISTFLSTYGADIIVLGLQLVANFALGILQGIPGLLQAAATILNNLSAKLSEADFSGEGLQMAVDIAIGIINGAISVVLSISNLISTALSKLREYFSDFNQSGKEMVTQIAIGLIKGRSSITASMGDLGFNLLSAIGEFIPWMVDMGFALIDALAEGIANGDILWAIGKLLMGLAKGIWNLFLGLVEGVVNLLNGIVNRLSFGLIELPPIDLDEFKFSGDKAKEEAKKIEDDLKKIEDSDIKAPTVDIQPLTEADIRAKEKAGEIPKSVADALIANLPAIDGATQQMANTVDMGTNQAATAGGDNWQELSNGVDEGFVAANQAVQQGATNMYNGAKQSFSKLAQVGKQSGTDLYNGMKTSITKLEQTVKQSCSNIYNQAGNSLKQFAQAGKQAFSDLYNGGANSMRSLSHTVQGCMNSVKSAINSISGAVNSAIADYNRLRNSLSKPINASVNIKQTKTVSTVAAAPAMAMAMSGAVAFGTTRDSGVSLGSGMIEKAQNIIENNIFLDGKLIAKTTAPYSDKEITKINNRMNRLGGKI